MPASLYIHVPFCRNICDYCKLYSIVENSPDVRRDYLDLLERQIAAAAPLFTDLRHIYIGGGTPSHLDEPQLLRLMAIISRHLPMSQIREFTVECNPGTVNREKFKILFEAGVNRLSFGAQSSSRKTRQVLGRRSSNREVATALDLALKAGFTNMGVDLIYGVPGQNLADLHHDLDTLLQLPISHFSAYSLIIEEDTALAARISEVDDELAVQMWHMLGERLGEHGFPAYEISNYAAPGRQCSYNSDVWLGGSYLGLGPAAHSFDGIRRWGQIADLQAWLGGHPPEIDECSAALRAAEVISTGLRMTDGWQKIRLMALYPDTYQSFWEAQMIHLAAAGYITQTPSSWIPSQRGLLFHDDLSLALLEAASGLP